jgi:S-adenosylmethionine decarboxylase
MKKFVAGEHIFIDMYGVQYTFDILMDALIVACERAGATIIRTDAHIFEERSDGDDAFTAYILLAESHCSVHTWPEHGYVGIDFFFCGDAKADEAIDYVTENIPHEIIQVTKNLRGAIDESTDRQLQERNIKEPTD